MGSFVLQASSGSTAMVWHGINWAGCHRRVRSLQNRIVQAVQAGAWRKVKRLSYLLVNSFSGRALAVKRVTENRGKKTAGMDGELWDTPEKKAKGTERIRNWKGYRPVALKRIYIPKKNGKRRPLSIPAMEDRARQALWLQALQPIAETQADPNSYGFRPRRQCADAIDQCFKVLRQEASSGWILEGDIEGFFDHIAFSWIEAHIPINPKVLGQWLRSGFIDQEQWFPSEAGVPQGGIISPVISNQVLDGLEAVVHGTPRERRDHQVHFVRWADDFIVTATTREFLEHTVLPRINAFLAERGVRLSPSKTLITPIEQGFDFLGQTLRKHPRPNGKPAKLQITPSKASLDAVKAKIKTLCRKARGAKPEQLIDKLNPVLRGWANYHRHVICAESFSKLDSFVWRRLYRWAKSRHPNKTGQWIAQRYFSLEKGRAWWFTDPHTGKQVIRVQATVKAQRHVKIRGAANPFDRQWKHYFHNRDRQMKWQTSSNSYRAILARQKGRCPVCRQIIEYDDELDLHHGDGNHQNNVRDNLWLLHPNCHRQIHHAPIANTELSRLERGVGRA